MVDKDNLKYVHTLSIGGVDYPLQIKMIDVDEYFSQVNKLYSRYSLNTGSVERNLKNKKSLDIAVTRLVAQLVYKSLFKIRKSVFGFKKPFRNYRYMLNSLLVEETEPFTSFVATMLNKDLLKDDTAEKKKQSD